MFSELQFRLRSMPNDDANCVKIGISIDWTSSVRRISKRSYDSERRSRSSDQQRHGERIQAVGRRRRDRRRAWSVLFDSIEKKTRVTLESIRTGRGRLGNVDYGDEANGNDELIGKSHDHEAIAAKKGNHNYESIATKKGNGISAIGVGRTIVASLQRRQADGNRFAVEHDGSIARNPKRKDEASRTFVETQRERKKDVGVIRDWNETIR